MENIETGKECCREKLVIRILGLGYEFTLSEEPISISSSNTQAGVLFVHFIPRQCPFGEGE